MPKDRASPVRPPPADSRPKNHLLAALSPEAFQRLAPYLTTVPIRVKQKLHTQGEQLRWVYFPNGGVVSVTTALSDGAMVEAATIGDEGMVGIEAFLGQDAVALGDAMMQVPDTDGERLSVADFRRGIGAPGGLAEIVGRYAQVHVAQKTVCNQTDRAAPHGQQCWCVSGEGAGTAPSADSGNPPASWPWRTLDAVSADGRNPTRGACG